MPSNSAFSAEERGVLLDLARGAIKKGLCGEEPRVSPDDYPEVLRAHKSTFVTLEVDSALRGCVGSLDAADPLVVDVVKNAFAAAFRDDRFPALTWPELERVAIRLSILSAPVPLPCISEDDLVRQLRPGVDGLILREGHHYATFLPAVWASIGDPREFVRNLKCKAGLPSNYWSPGISIERYTTETFSR